MDNTLLLGVILCIYAKNVQVSILVLMDIALILVQNQTIAITHIQQSKKFIIFKKATKKHLKTSFLTYQHYPASQ